MPASPCVFQDDFHQYHKEGQALRTETTINDTRDFGIGRLLRNLPELRRVGFAANRRLLGVERISHDCALGEDAFQELQQPCRIDRQRVPALRFADPQGHALLMFVFLAQGSTRISARSSPCCKGCLPPTFLPAA